MLITSEKFSKNQTGAELDVTVKNGKVTVSAILENHNTIAKFSKAGNHTENTLISTPWLKVGDERNRRVKLQFKEYSDERIAQLKAKEVTKKLRNVTKGKATAEDMKYLKKYFGVTTNTAIEDFANKQKAADKELALQRKIAKANEEKTAVEQVKALTANA